MKDPIFKAMLILSLVILCYKGFYTLHKNMCFSALFLVEMSKKFIVLIFSKRCRGKRSAYETRSSNGEVHAQDSPSYKKYFFPLSVVMIYYKNKTKLKFSVKHGHCKDHTRINKLFVLNIHKLKLTKISIKNFSRNVFNYRQTTYGEQQKVLTKKTYTKSFYKKGISSGI